jgi:branched-chain amino acid transport system ATP-binding protein
MNFGAKIAEGSPAEIQSHPEVLKAYLGEEE